MKPNWDERRLAVWRNQGIRGMTRGLFFRMWEQQDGKCRICSEVLSVGSSGRSGFTLDHDHDTGRPRSLLCQGCNKHAALKEGADIDQFKDTPYYDYVQQHRKVNDVEGLDGSGEDKMDSRERRT
jgi:hypothetical protein